MAAATFATGLGGYLDSKPKLSLVEKRLKKVLDAKPSKRRTRLLERLEKHARVELGYSQTEKIDWSSIDWAAILDFLLKLFVILAPLFLSVLVLVFVVAPWFSYVPMLV